MLVASALGELAARGPQSSATSSVGAVPRVPQRQQWADADALAGSDGEFEDELDDDFADNCKRACPDDELNACGTRVEEEAATVTRAGDDGWESRRSRCRRSEPRERARSEDAAAARHAGSSRSPCRGDAPAVAELRRAVDTVKVAVVAPAFSRALPDACGQLMGALQGSAAGNVPSAPQQDLTAAKLPHPVLVAASAAGGRVHATC